MKEKIYTIPISEAFATSFICPFCTMEHQMESNFIESALGASMMEPDIRIKTNETGFCHYHFEKLKEQQKALPLALILQTHVKEQKDQIFLQTKSIKKKTLFGEKEDYKAAAQALADQVDKLTNSCYICNKVNETMNKFIENAVYIWESESEFKQVFNHAPSFCLSHFSMLLKSAIKTLNSKKFQEFFEMLQNKQARTLDELYEDITMFANSFDYRNSEPTSEKVKSAVKRTIELL